MSGDTTDVCVVGSGAGAAPVAWTLARAGLNVVVLEKGPWLREADFVKDEIAVCRRHAYLPDLERHPQTVETLGDDDVWRWKRTSRKGWDFQNGSLVGGSSNLMSGFFHRLEPLDFRLRSEFGPVEDADVVDWPLDYAALEPWYDLVEKEVGVSGRAVAHPRGGPRSSPDFPQPPLAEHPVAAWFDEAARAAGLHPLPLPRAVLSRPLEGRGSCSYSHYCALYGCATGAKGSARAALLDRAVATGRCEVRPRSMVAQVVTDGHGKATHVEYFDPGGTRRRLGARVFVVACQAIETARLLLMSTGPRHRDGLGNRSGLLGRYLLFSAAGSAYGTLRLEDQTEARARELAQVGPFLNRSLQDWYVLPAEGGRPRRKGGTLDLIFEHANPISNARYEMFDGDRPLVWGWPLKRRLERYFKGGKSLKFEAFADWMPVPDSRVTLDPKVRDAWGLPVARVSVGRHPRNREVAAFLAERAGELLRAMGAKSVRVRGTGGPSTNLQAGGCRFGPDPDEAVLDVDGRVHGTDNVYVSDGSFMPTGGSVPYTWTIYANAFRVGDALRRRLA